MLALSIEKVTKRYRKHLVLDNVSLQVDSNISFGLVGVNGAGKTTLIKSILDFCDIQAGSISIFGQQHRDPSARSRLAFLPERFVPPYYFKGKDFLRYMSQLYRTEMIDNEVVKIFNILDLDISALNKPVRNFSKGMAQKLGLAACFLSGKDLFIFDEPMSGLDPKARASLKNYLQQLKTQGSTLFFSTHLLTDVEALCDRIAILHEGAIRFIGSPARCCQQYDADNLEQAYLRCIEGEAVNSSSEVA